jgi:hypothetical protein
MNFLNRKSCRKFIADKDFNMLNIKQILAVAKYLPVRGRGILFAGKY